MNFYQTIFISRIMQRTGLISLAIAICLQFSLGHADDVAAKGNSEASQDTSLSRAKRGSYDMMRLGRGLHMLRLGKRNYESTGDDDEDFSDTLAWPKAYNELYPDSLGSYDTNNFLEDNVEVPAHWRFRRSTSAANGAAPVEVIQQTNKAPKEHITADLKDGNGDELLVNFPDQNEYLTDDMEDNIIQPQEEGDEYEKRNLGMLRLGKRQLSMLRLGKRSLNMLRMGKREPEDDEEKRSLGMLRLGKRQLSMLRLGKRSSLGMLRLGKRPNENLDEVYSDDNGMVNEIGKRPMSMLRLGKRPMSMLRLGKRPMSMLRLGKRPMSMLRLGKRPMSMLRLGKREEEEKRSTR